MGQQDEAASSWLTLEALCGAQPFGPEILSKRVALMRHSFEDDVAALNEAGLDPTQFREFSKSAEQKLIDLRMSPQLVEAFTSEQESDCLTVGGKLAEYVLVFAGTEGLTAEYLGAFRIKGRMADFEAWSARYKEHIREVPTALHQAVPSPGCLYEGLGVSSSAPGHVFYDLETAEGVLPGLAGRLVVQWPRSRNWVLRKGSWPDGYDVSFQVDVIRGPGFVMEFPGYRHVDLSWSELHRIVNSPLGNSEWKAKLSAVSGVYLITDTASREGKLYVGSATGSDGIWGRWKGYVTGERHNGNERLKDLLAGDKSRCREWRFSLLEVMARTTDKREALAAESAWKRRLGSRAFGLNAN